MFQRLDLLPAGLTVCVEPKKYKRVNNLATYVGVNACISYESLLKTVIEGKSERNYVELCSMLAGRAYRSYEGIDRKEMHCTSCQRSLYTVRTLPELGDQGDDQHSRASP
jgi:hypothetical protein